MSATTGLIVFLAAIVIAVVVGTKTKCNIGIAGICLAFILGTFLMDKTIAKVIGYFPTSLLFIMMIVTMFYGYAAANGAIKGIADRLIYLCRNKLWAIPIMLYAACFIVSTLGAGAGAAPVIVSPIAFSLCSGLGFNPVLAFLAVALGSLGGGIQPWSSTGVMFKGIAENFIGAEMADAVTCTYGIMLFIAPTIFYMICYFVLKGYKIGGNAEVKKPEPFNLKQKQTLALISIVMVLVIIPVFANMFFPNPVTKWIGAHFDVKVLCALGIVACSALKLGDTNDIIKNKIPWGTIIMICGMSTMIGIGVETGVADLMGGWLGTNIPSFLILPVVCILGGLLSFVTTGPAVIFPLFIPMFPALSEATGISVVALTVALFAGTGATGLSPFSQGGAMAITGCKDDAVRESLWKKQLVLAILFLALYAILGLLGVFEIVANIFS